MTTTDDVQFTIKPEHLQLLKNACVRWNGIEAGAPGIDPKRPYGDSDVISSILEILGETAGPDDYEPWTPAQHNRALALHEDMGIVLEIVLAAQSFESGVYGRGLYEYRAWRRVS